MVYPHITTQRLSGARGFSKPHPQSRNAKGRNWIRITAETTTLVTFNQFNRTTIYIYIYISPRPLLFAYLVNFWTAYVGPHQPKTGITKMLMFCNSFEMPRLFIGKGPVSHGMCTTRTHYTSKRKLQFSIMASSLFGKPYFPPTTNLRRENVPETVPMRNFLLWVARSVFAWFFHL